MDEVNSGNFRLDLYYRINVLDLEIPPCGCAARTLPHWPGIFSGHCMSGGDVGQFNPSQRHATTDDYDWPGNVRQLRNVDSAGLRHQ